MVRLFRLEGYKELCIGHSLIGHFPSLSFKPVLPFHIFHRLASLRSIHYASYLPSAYRSPSHAGAVPLILFSRSFYTTVLTDHALWYLFGPDFFDLPNDRRIVATSAFFILPPEVGTHGQRRSPPRLFLPVCNRQLEALFFFFALFF